MFSHAATLSCPDSPLLPKISNEQKFVSTVELI
jgi:hypothetical protein